MDSRRSWGRLSAAYRQRLARSGITRAGYESGGSLQRARGHDEREHVARLERGIRRGLSPAQARGRPAPGEARASQVHREFPGVPTLGAGGATELRDLEVSAGQSSRVGAYLSDVGALLDGRLDAAAFQRRWRGRRVAGRRLEWRASRVVEAQRRQGPPGGAERYRRTLPGRVA